MVFHFFLGVKHPKYCFYNYQTVMPPQRFKKKEAAQSQEAKKQGKVYQPPPTCYSQAKEMEAKLDPIYVDQPDEYKLMDEDKDEDLLS